MTFYPVSVTIKNGYVKATANVTVSMTLPAGAETIIDFGNVYIADPSNYLVKRLIPNQVIVETGENVLTAIFEAASLFRTSSKSEVTMVVGLTDVIIPIGKTQEYDSLVGTARFNKNVIGTVKKDRAKPGQIRFSLITPGTDSPDILFRPKHAKITITGENITNTMAIERDFPLTGTLHFVIPQIPVGANTALIQVLDSDGNELANRIQNFYMISKDKMDLGSFVMGIKIDENGSCLPSNIQVPYGSKLFWENWDYNNDRTVSLNNGAITIGPIPKAVKAANPGEYDTFANATHTFQPLAGDQWERILSDPAYNFYDMWVFADNDILVVGRKLFHGTYVPFIVHFDGVDWYDEFVGEEFFNDSFGCIFALSRGDIYVGSNQGRIVHSNGGSWNISYQTPLGSISGIWGAGSGDVFAIQENTILHFDGATWSKVYEVDYNLHDLWASSNDVYAIGEYGLLVHYSNGVWTQEYIDPANYFHYYCIWGTSPTDIFVGGDNGTLLHYNGVSWEPIVGAAYSAITAIYGTSAKDDVYVVNQQGAYHYDGSQLTLLNAPLTTPEYLIGCKISPTGKVYFCGFQVILRYDPNASSGDQLYVYDQGLGSPGSIFAFYPPVVESITDADLDNIDPTDGSTNVSFTINGKYFGESQVSVNGRVRFIDVNLYQAYEAALTNWTDNAINGDIMLPAGKYLVEVTAYCTPSIKQVYFYKGTGFLP